jgi:hypothetical protein
MIIGFDYVAASTEARFTGHRRHADQWQLEQHAEKRLSRWRPQLKAALRALAAASAAQYPLPFVPELRDYPVRRP